MNKKNHHILQQIEIKKKVQIALKKTEKNDNNNFNDNELIQRKLWFPNISYKCINNNNKNK